MIGLMDEPKGGEPNFLVISLGDEPKNFGEVGGEVGGGPNGRAKKEVN